MTVLFDGEIRVEYRFLFLSWARFDEQPELLSARGGQVNGLCGAASPGWLSMVTGLHTGEVPVTVELLSEAPALDGSWEDVVEASCRPTSTRWVLSAFDAWEELAVPVPLGPVRARWCARGMDAANHADLRREGEPALDRYLLQLWPETGARPDEVLRETSAAAREWHRVARETPPPPPPPDPAQVAAAAREADRLARVQQEALRLATVWGGVAPSDRVRDVGGSTAQVFRVDPDLVEGWAVLTGDRLRRLAVEVARGACRDAGLEDLPTVRAALAALEAGHPPPPPFDDRGTGIDAVLGPDVLGDSVLTTVAWWGREAPPRTLLDPAVAAACALVSTGQADPLRAVVDAVAEVMASREDEADYLRGLRAGMWGGTSAPGRVAGAPPTDAPD